MYINLFLIKLVKLHSFFFSYTPLCSSVKHVSKHIAFHLKIALYAAPTTLKPMSLHRYFVVGWTAGASSPAPSHSYHSQPQSFSPRRWRPRLQLLLPACCGSPLLLPQGPFALRLTLEF